MIRLPAVILALILVAGLFYGGRQPIAVGLLVAPWDKVAHAAVFCVLAGLISAFRWPATGVWLCISAFGAIAIGAADEMHQHFLPGREADWLDLIADAIGSGIGIGLAFVITRGRVTCNESCDLLPKNTP